MNYLYHILNILHLNSNSIRFIFIKKNVNNEITGKVKNEINISNKNIKVYFIIYLLMVLFFLFIPTLWFVFFPVTLIDQIIEINNKISFINTFIIFISILIFNIICIFVKRYIIFKGKEASPSNINIYNRELPENLTPTHVRLLVLDGKIDSKTLASTILDLIDRGYLKLETTNKSEVFAKDLYISKTDKAQNELFGYEKYLIKWFFEKDKISSFELRKKLNDISNNPYEKFSIFQGLVLLSFPFEKYYIKNFNDIEKTKKYAKSLVVSLIFFMLNIFTIKNIVIYGILEFLSLIGLSRILFKLPDYLLNEKGAEVKDSYLDLKKYLLDFSLINEKSSEMIILWNYFLSYSIALDIEGVASEEINNFFGNNIYNLNNQQLSSEEEIKKLIDDIPNEIERSKKIYELR